MRKAALYKSVAFGGAALLVLGIIGLFTFGQSMKWVGHTNLAVSFIVTDISTGQPIPNAIIHVRAEPGGFCEQTDALEFTIATDDKGFAKHLCKRCMSFGSKSLFEDTFFAHLPSWWYQVTADGYSESNPEYLDVPKNASQVQHGKTTATITIPIGLAKAAA
jgi:hypothetical protein